MSAKLRLTLWFTLMVLLLSAMVLVFVFVINANSVTDDPAQRLVDDVLDNLDEAEMAHGQLELDDVRLISRGVCSALYDENGRELLGALPEGLDTTLPFQDGTLRTVSVSGVPYYLYDAYRKIKSTGLWSRGVVRTDNRSGLMHVIVILTITLIPSLLVLSTAGGWFIAVRTFRPMERITKAANGISRSGELSGRIRMKRGPKEMRALADAFDRMFDRLEASFLAERQFASDASHELRTPLTVVLAECGHARQHCVTREDFLASVGVIEEKSLQMSCLVRQLLLLTRMEHKSDAFSMQTGDLSAFVQAVCGDFTASHPSVRLETSLEPCVTAVFDPGLMAMLLQNLLENAEKFSAVDPRVEVSVGSSGGTISLRVRDHGTGIAAEDLDKVFQRFWQADSARSEGGSSGLGLAIVREIACFHGGEVCAECVPDGGSRFTVTLPCECQRKPIGLP
jgi:signal transduction histidine kinase